MIMIADVTEGMNFKMLESLLKSEKYTNFRICSVRADGEGAILFTEYFKKQHIGFTSYIIGSSHILHKRFISICGLSDKTYYCLFSTVIRDYLVQVLERINLTSREELEMIPSNTIESDTADVHCRFCQGTELFATNNRLCI